MAGKLKKGSKVAWSTPQGKAVGKVEKKLTSPTHIKGQGRGVEGRSAIPGGQRQEREAGGAQARGAQAAWWRMSDP